MSKTSEGFQPVAHNSPDKDIKAKLIFYVRMLVDFQMNTVYRFMKKHLPSLRGKVLDVGCGNSPFRHLLDASRTEYTGADIAAATHFKYNAQDIVQFDGAHLPFEDNSIDNIICTEVLEHAESPDTLCAEIIRVLKPAGAAYVTIPWSARFHYIPYDYNRFTPTRIKQLFAKAAQVDIAPRGTDMSAIGNKIIVMYARSLTTFGPAYPIRLLLCLVFLPALLLAVVMGFLSLYIKIGTTEDPLGYSIILKKT